LGDATREAIVLQLQRGPLPAGRIAAGFRMTRPAVSRHLRILRQAGWVVEERDGRHRYYRLARPALAAALEWLNGLARPGGARTETRSAPAAGAKPRDAAEDWAPWSA
jgi:DNA-binding transcriptional ArsR family regulator